MTSQTGTQPAAAQLDGTGPETVITVSGPVPSSCAAAGWVPVCDVISAAFLESSSCGLYSPSPPAGPLPSAGSASSAARIRYKALRVSVRTCLAWAPCASVPALMTW